MPFFSSSKSAFGPSGRSRKLFNLATGGVVTYVANYNGTGKLWKIHIFTAGSGTLTILQSPNIFRVLICGGGGAGGFDARGNGMGGNGGGVWINDSIQIPTGSYAISVGSGGSQGTSSSSGGSGGGSSFQTIASVGGGSGGQHWNNLNGSPRPGTTSNITGINDVYGEGGAVRSWAVGASGSGTYGYGSGGGASNWVHPGGSGCIIVAYALE